jgi:hypothetical protein
VAATTTACATATTATPSTVPYDNNDDEFTDLDECSTPSHLNERRAVAGAQGREPIPP